MVSDDAGDAKGSRPRVVRLKLGYKSATVDEFIEKYALDVSPRGIYVNIGKPLAVGTLVKLEIRLASEQLIIKGAASVVWNRDRAQASGTRPGGLWLKFIQIDEPSKAFIEKLVSARADAGLAYEEHGEEEEAEDATVVGSPAQSHQEAPAPPVPAAPRLRATLVGIMAPATLPARPRLPSLPPAAAPPPAKALPLPAPTVPPVPAAPRLRATLVGITAPAAMLPPRTKVSSLPPGPLPLPAKARSVTPPPGRAYEEQGETDAEDATVVWGEAPAASTRKASLTGVTPPATLPARPPLPSLPPPRAPLPRARAAPPQPARAYEEQSEEDAEDDTFIWDHEPSHQEASASPVSTRGADARSTDASRAPPTPGAPPVVATAQEGAARAASLRTTVITTRSPSPPPRESPQWARTGAWVALGFFAAVALALAIRSTDWFRALTTVAASPGAAGGGAISATATMTSAETAPVPALRAVEAPADAAPAAMTPAGVAEAPPTMSTSPQAIAVPIPAPGPKPAPGPRATSPVVTGISTVPAKPKPKPAPAPTIDDGF